MSGRPHLAALSAHFGILPGFRDFRGAWREPDDETRISLLSAMGVDGSSEDAAATALRDAQAAAAADRGVAVLDRDARRIDAGTLSGPLGAYAGELVLRSEDGYETAAPVSCERRDSSLFVHLDVEAVPAVGYYDAELRHDGESVAQWLLLAPPSRMPSVVERCGDARALGVMVNLYALRGEENAGVGDFGDLRRAARRLGELGVAFLGTSPVHATGNRGSGTSPYYPSSRCYVNPLYLDVAAVSGHRAGARLLVESPDLRTRLDRARESARIDHREVLGLKLPLLEAACADMSSAERRAFAAYCASEGEDLEAFATFEALAEELSAKSPGEPDWRSWPLAFQDPRSKETRAFAASQARRVSFHRWLQWQADRQLDSAGADLALGLFLDLAVGTAPGGAETWAHRDVFAAGVELGCPPDDYSPSGQCWGLAPLSPPALRVSGYVHLRRVLASSLRHAGALRIDHAMGLVRQFWVPSGEPAARGAYVSLEGRETFAVLAIECAKSGTVIVAEDLGTVPDGFREELAARGALRTQVVYFERDDAGEFRRAEEYEANAFVSANNHDLPPLGGFAAGVDLVARAEAGLLPSGMSLEGALAEREEAARALMRRLVADGALAEDEVETGDLTAATTRFLVRAPCALVGIALDDLGAETVPVNVPGSVATDAPHWTRRMRRTVDEILEDPATTALLAEAAATMVSSVVMPIDGCLDLHSFRPGDIAPLVEDYVRECRRRGLYEVRIVHGKGTGTLRRTVEALLPRLEGVVGWRSGRADEGAWGATMVTLEPMSEEDDTR